MMTIKQQLVRGQRVPLEESMRQVLIGLDWTAGPTVKRDRLELDVSAFLLGPYQVCMQESDLVFYGNLSDQSGAVRFIEEEPTEDGGSGSTGARLRLDLSRVPASIETIMVSAAIYEAEEREQNLSQLSNICLWAARARSENDVKGDAVLNYNLTETFSRETAVVVCGFVRDGGGWLFHAVGIGVEGGLAALCANYGLDVT